MFTCWLEWAEALVTLVCAHILVIYLWDVSKVFVCCRVFKGTATCVPVRQWRWGDCWKLQTVIWASPTRRKVCKCSPPPGTVLQTFLRLWGMLSYNSCSFCQILKNSSTSFSSFSELSRFSRSGNVANTFCFFFSFCLHGQCKVGQFLTGPWFPDYLHTVIITHTHRLAVASMWLEVEFGWHFSNTAALLHFMHSCVRTQPATSSLWFKGDGNICLVVVEVHTV